MIKAKEKKERALGIKLFLKPHRCNSPKCALSKKPYKPGMHGKTRARRPTASEFGQQLLEKQKIKTIYGLKEAQMRKIFQQAAHKGEALNQLERRLDNVVFRLGFAPSRIMARQFLSHGHFFVNGKKVTIPSYQTRPSETISLKPSSRNLLIFKDLTDNVKKRILPEWLAVDIDKLEGKIKSQPTDVEEELFDINSVVDYYSR